MSRKKMLRMAANAIRHGMWPHATKVEMAE